MIRNTSFGLFALLVNLINATTAIADSKEDPLCYKVGVVIGLTGKSASVGEAIRNGIELALNSTDSEPASCLTVSYDDYGSDSKNAVSGYERFKQSGADVILSVMSNAGNALSPLAEKDQIPLISLAMDRGISRGKRYVCSIFALTDDLAHAAVLEAQKRGYHKLALVFTSHEGNVAQSQSLLHAAQGLLEVTRTEEILPSETDFKAMILRIKALNGVDAVANLLHPHQAGLFARQAHDYGLTLPEFSLGNFEDAAVIADARGALEGQWFPTVDYKESYIQQYRTTFPGASLFTSGFSYDAILLLRQAARRHIAPKTIPEYLSSAGGFAGATTPVSWDGDSGFRYPIKIHEVAGNSFR